MDIQYCVNHNEPILFFDANISDPNLRGLCRICVKQNNKHLKTVEEEADEKQKAFDQLKQQPQQIIQAIVKLIQDINQYKKIVNMILDMMINNIVCYVEIIGELKNKSSLKISIDEYKKSINEKNQVIKMIVIEQLEKLKSVIRVDKIMISLKELFEINTIEKKQQKIEIIKKFIPFEYKKLDKGKKQIENCYSITFNSDASLIFYGCDKLVKISKFENGQILNEIQELNGHTNNVTCLEYMKSSNQLVSASVDSTIIIWKRDKLGQWKVNQKLSKHKEGITSLVPNQKEDKLISGSSDKTIKFWQRQNLYWVCQQTIQTRFDVSGLSLDDESLKLIACGYDIPEILVFSKLNNEWIFTQIIKVQKYGLRLCFIGSNMFAFQPNGCDQLEIYQFSKQLNQYFKIQEVQVKSSKDSNMSLPCQFISSKEILVVKNDAYLNIVRRQEDGQFITQQSIDFQTGRLYGRATASGLYLVTWDVKSKEIQIRQLKYIK